MIPRSLRIGCAKELYVRLALQQRMAMERQGHLFRECGNFRNFDTLSLSGSDIHRRLTPSLDAHLIAPRAEAFSTFLQVAEYLIWCTLHESRGAPAPFTPGTRDE